ncbi:MAG: DUF2189 domain-containing protein [Alphaproteobacteria bacterium]|nr:DUF2189 domain-containing protein [Alphaproteobacteria bacterium]
MSDIVSRETAKTFPDVAAITMDHPWSWLEKGWRDMLAAPVASLTYGVIAAAIGGLLALGFYEFSQLSMILPVAAGFMLAGPAGAVGLYAISRDLAAGQRPSFFTSTKAWRTNPEQIAVCGLILGVVYLIWIRSAMVIYAITFQGSPPDLERFFIHLFQSEQSLQFLFVGTIVGGILATIAFMTAAVSFPMLLDRKGANAFVAVITSWRAVLANPRPMALWGFLIVVFISFGLATLFVGLVITLPLIGHASWHAYRDLVRQPAKPTQH